jgi:hypoxia up-regulated 1
LTKAELGKIKDRLKAFAASDNARFQREEALNQLEGYTYKVRDLLEGDSFTEASTEKERTELAKIASEIGDWLYEDGADATKEVLKTKLKTLQDIVVPVQTRINEAEERPGRITALKQSMKRITEYLDSMHLQIKEYAEWEATAASASASSTTSASTETPSGDFDGLEDDDAKDTKKSDEAEEKPGPIPPLFDAADLKELEALLKGTKDWLSEMEAKQEKLPATADAVLLVKDIGDKMKKLDKVSLDLALKGAETFGGKAEKAAKKIKKSKSKKGGEDAEDFKGQRFTEKQLEEMLERLKTMEKEQDKDKGKDKKPKKAKKSGNAKESDKKKSGHDEL